MIERKKEKKKKREKEIQKVVCCSYMQFMLEAQEGQKAAFARRISQDSFTLGDVDTIIGYRIVGCSSVLLRFRQQTWRMMRVSTDGFCHLRSRWFSDFTAILTCGYARCIGV